MFHIGTLFGVYYKKDVQRNEMMLNLVQTQKQTLKISPAQIQLLNFLQLNILELNQYLKNELEENPVLDEGVEDTKDEFADAELGAVAGQTEDKTQDYMDWEEFGDEDVPDYRTRIQQNLEEDTTYLPIVAQEISWREELKEQFGWLLPDERQKQLAFFLVESLSDEGYLAATADALADDVSFMFGQFVEEAEVQALVAMLHQMEPAGLGACNLQHCLLLQLQRREGTEIAQKLIENHFGELATHNYDKLMRESGLSAAELKSTIGIVTTLNPRPVSHLANGVVVKDNIVPDYIVTIDGEFIEVALNKRGIPPLRINHAYAQEVGGSRAANSYVNSKINAANWLIEAIMQRESTMLKAMRTLVVLQRDYFMTGDARLLKPMVLRHVAERIKMDISTVSRVTSGKYVQTPFGVIHVKNLFTEGIMTDTGQVVSSRQIQSSLAELVANEDKQNPLNDSQLAEMLSQRGYPIARRTVAKYRDVLGISAVALRQTL